MTLIELILLYGAIVGGIYALLALGFTLIYGVAGVTNLAHGSFFMLGAYVVSAFSFVFFKLDPILSVFFAVIIVGVSASVIYRLAIHPVIEDEVAVMVVTVSLALILQQLMLLIFTAENRPVPTFVEGSTVFLGVTLTYARMLSFVLSIALFAILFAFISKTKIGKAMRAVSQDREVAMLMGVNTERIYMLTMALSAVLAAVAGIFIASSTTGVAASWMWLTPLGLSFSIVTLGGLGSIKGSLIGGFIIGYAEQAVAISFPEGGAIIPVVPFTVLVLVLLIRPKGLFGKRVEMED
jgi:branched-chain amino acid transport system permease protein